MSINQRIKIFLKDSSLSSAKLSEMLGISTSAVSQVIMGKTNLKLENFAKLVEHNPKLNARWLLTGYGNMHEEVGSMEIQEDVEAYLKRNPCKNCEEKDELIISLKDQVATQRELIELLKT